MELRTSATIDIPRDPAAVFDYATDPANLPKAFRGYGPVPAVERTEMLEGSPMRTGAVRRIHNSDGSTIDEHIDAHEPPHRHAYHLGRGIPAPFSWIVTTGIAEWTFTPRNGGTRILWTYTFPLTSPLAYPLGVLVSFLMQGAMQRCLERVREGLVR
jgi:uncharacterized protein YndB with AHSA1/START domain